eukprot:COSAG01_NODE_5874_length_3978_cov_2.018041_1_plen_67_part_10
MCTTKIPAFIICMKSCTVRILGETVCILGARFALGILLTISFTSPARWAITVMLLAWPIGRLSRENR